MKNKKPLWITLVALDLALTGFLFVVSIIMLANTPKPQEERDAMTGFIGFLVQNPDVYLWAFVVPLFVLLVANIIGLVFYVKNVTKRRPVTIKELTAEQKEALKQELLKGLDENPNEPKE